MLENLINSRAKKKILNICFKYPKRSFHINELRAMDAGQKRGILAALKELVRADVIQSAVKKQQRYFRVNPRYKLYDELKDLVSDHRLSSEDEISKLLKRVSGARLAILSGIFTFESHLSADALIVGEINRKSFYKIISEIEKLAGQEINYTIMDREEYEYRKTMSDRFLRDIFDHNHIVVINNLKKSH